MRRLLTTVAFSALVLGVAAPGWAADPAANKSATQPAPSGQMSPSAQSNQPGAQPSTQSGNQATNQTMPGGQTMSPNQATSSAATADKSSADKSSTGQSATESTAKSAAAGTASAPKKKVVHHARAGSSSDRMANELNRQELARIASGTSTSYGSSR